MIQVGDGGSGGQLETPLLVVTPLLMVLPLKVVVEVAQCQIHLQEMLITQL